MTPCGWTVLLVIAWLVCCTVENVFAHWCDSRDRHDKGHQ